MSSLWYKVYELLSFDQQRSSHQYFWLQRGHMEVGSTSWLGLKFSMQSMHKNMTSSNLYNSFPVNQLIYFAVGHNGVQNIRVYIACLECKHYCNFNGLCHLFMLEMVP